MCEIGNVAEAARHINSGIKPTHECVVAAIRSGDDSTLNLVVSHNAPLDNVDSDGKSPLDYAYELGNASAIALLTVSRHFRSALVPRAAAEELLLTS